MRPAGDGPDRRCLPPARSDRVRGARRLPRRLRARRTAATRDERRDARARAPHRRPHLELRLTARRHRRTARPRWRQTLPTPPRPHFSATGATPTTGSTTPSTTGDSSAALDPSDPVVWRNLALDAYNHRHDPQAATAAYERALQQAPGDARLLSESDQLLKRIGAPTDVRLDRLEELPSALIWPRDDLAVEYAQLLVTAADPSDALRGVREASVPAVGGRRGSSARGPGSGPDLALADHALARGDAGRSCCACRSGADPHPSRWARTATRWPTRPGYC